MQDSEKKKIYERKEKNSTENASNVSFTSKVTVYIYR